MRRFYGPESSSKTTLTLHAIEDVDAIALRSALPQRDRARIDAASVARRRYAVALDRCDRARTDAYAVRRARAARDEH